MSLRFITKSDKRILTASVFLFFLVFASVLWLELTSVQQSKQALLQSEVKSLAFVVDKVLGDARLAIAQAQPLLGQPCNTTLEKKLNIIPTRYPHLQSLNFTQGNTIYCSSLLYNKGYTLSPALSLQQGIRVDRVITSPHDFIMMLYVSYPAGRIFAASDVRIIVERIKNMAFSDRIVLRMNDKILTASGVKPGSLQESHFSHYIKAESYNKLYTIAWRKNELGDALAVIAHSWRYIAMIIASALVSSILLWLLLSHRASLPHHLAVAIRRNEIQPYYQPIVCAKTNRVIGAEVLARWQHCEAGSVSPDIFIPVAERAGLIADLTKGLLDLVVIDIQRSVTVFKPGFKFNLNISHAHLVKDSFYSFIGTYSGVFREQNLQLVFEITERGEIEVNDDISNKIDYMKIHNVGLSLDDFGTGFSNLSYITGLRPENIKIGRMFINLISEGKNTPLVDCVVEMAQRMRIQTTAEGVEHKYQVDYLRSKNVDFFQGYFFSRPLSFANFIRFIRGYQVVT